MNPSPFSWNLAGEQSAQASQHEPERNNSGQPSLHLQAAPGKTDSARNLSEGGLLLR